MFRSAPRHVLGRHLTLPRAAGVAATAMALNAWILVFGTTMLAQELSSPTTNLDHDRYLLPPPEVQEVLSTDTNYATLSYANPGRSHFLVPLRTTLSTLDLMSRKTYRLGELEIRPETDRLWHLDTFGIYDFRFYSLEERAYVDVDFPEEAFASDFTWSPDGELVAFLAHLQGGTEVWTAEAATGRLNRLSEARVLATLGTGTGGQGSQPSRMLQWTPEGSVLALLVPPERDLEPPEPPLPVGPLTRRTREEPTSAPTYPFLLEDEHDEALFEHYTTSQLAELSEGSTPHLIGEPAMYESVSVDPSGRYILATVLERPFSFITSYRGFPRSTIVLDRAGTLLATLDEEPLREGRGGGGNDGPRAISWRPDGAGLAYLEREPDDEDSDDAESEERPDRLMLLEPPFELSDARIVAESEDPIQSVVYSPNAETAFATVSEGGERAIVSWDLRSPDPERSVLVDFHETDDPTTLPGSLLTLSTSNGLDYGLVSSDGSAAYLEGSGYSSDFRPRPFIDRVSIQDGSTTRVFEGSPEAWERALLPLDPDLTRMIVSRESATDFPDSYLWSEDGWGDNLTNNSDPFPEITAARRIDFDFSLPSGVVVQGRISMPVEWRDGDPPVPAIFWTYPSEYEEAEDYDRDAIRERNKNAFTHMSWLRWSDIWLTQGYALVDTDIPIIGENYNDTYVSNLLTAMYGAIRAVDNLGVVDVDKIGHGGHSYGAFATANILANSPYFKAGIAGDGAYNRTLTPDGFQAERRSIWEAPQTYLEMSPFFKADQIDVPLLMYHGGDDNNTGTFPIQSRRMISALTILGKTAVLYEYPFESHTPRAIENKLDMWARFIDWFDTYVKETERDPEAVGLSRDLRSPGLM